MLDKLRREKLRSRSPAVTPTSVPADLHPMIATKLWDNPCWLSFRANFIAHHFNQPIYDWIARFYKLSAPEHVVLYAVGLKEGITADDVAASSARPKNTLSRAVNSLLAKRLLTRVQDKADRRRMQLYLTRRGRRIVDETVPALVAIERNMVAVLSAAEQRLLNQLLTKLVLNKNAWPTRIDQERRA
jgi:DNA-binding MarR family transcriptional regulator